MDDALPFDGDQPLCVSQLQTFLVATWLGLPLVVAPSGELHDFVKVNKIGLAFKEMNILQITDGIIALEKNRESFSRFHKNVFSIQSTFDRRKQAVYFADLILMYMYNLFENAFGGP